MDEMEIMIEMMGSQRLRLKTKEERIFYSSLLGYSDSRKTSSLFSLIDLVHFVIHNLRFSIFNLHNSLGAILASFDSSKALFPRVTYLTLRCFTSLHGSNPRNIGLSSNHCIFLSNPD
jgi:hypothetical protein